MTTAPTAQLIYHHVDQDACNALTPHLASLTHLRLNQVKVLDLETVALENAAVTVLLLSASLLACKRTLDQLMTKVRRQETRLIPVLWRAVLLKHTPLQELQILSANGGPISEAPFPDTAWVEVTRAVADAIHQTHHHAIISPCDTPRRWAWPATLDIALPARDRRLRGRDQTLRALAQEMDPQSLSHGVLIGAIGGMGKTALARALCREFGLCERFDLVLGASAKLHELTINLDEPSPQIVKARPSLRPRSATIPEYLRQIAEQLGMAQANLLPEADLCTALKDQLAERSALLIWDNLDDRGDLDAALTMLARLTMPPQHKVLITSRLIPSADPLYLHQVRLTKVEDEVEVRAMVNDFVEEAAHGASAPYLAAEEALCQISKLSDGHPLAAQLLVGKLLIDGSDALCKQRQLVPRKGANDEALWFKTLWDFIFDEHFKKHIGPFGLALLQNIARRNHGLSEKTLRAAYAEDPALDLALSRLFSAYCITRVPHRGGTILDMHPVTREYVRSISE